MAVPMIKSRFSIASIVKTVIYYRYCFYFGHKNKGKGVGLILALPPFLTLSQSETYASIL